MKVCHHLEEHVGGEGGTALGQGDAGIGFHWTAPIGNPSVPPIRGSSVFTFSVCLYVGHVFTTAREIGKIEQIG